MVHKCVVGWLMMTRNWAALSFGPFEEIFGDGRCAGKCISSLSIIPSVRQERAGSMRRAKVGMMSSSGMIAEKGLMDALQFEALGTLSAFVVKKAPKTQQY